MENVILYLIGYPGTGKLTIGREIAASGENIHLIDNHQTTNLIFPFVERTKDLSTHPMWTYIREIRDVVYRFVSNEADPRLNFVFTNFLLEQERDTRVYNKVLAVAEKRNAIFIPIKLMCDVEVIKQRMTSEDRVLNLKLTNVKVLDNMVKNGPPLINIEHPNALTLNVTNLSPSVAKERILEWVETILHG